MKKSDALARIENRMREEKEQAVYNHKLYDARKKAYEVGETDELNLLLSVPTNWTTAYNESLIPEKQDVSDMEFLLETARNHTLTEDEKINLTELVKNETRESLEKHTVETLKDLCKTFDIPVTGKKADLVKRILDYSHSHTLPEYAGPTLFNYLLKSGYTENLTKMLIRKISKGNSDIANTCFDIVCNYYNDEIFADLCQAVNLKLWELFRNGLMVFADNRLVFREVIKDENGSFCGYGKFIFDRTVKKDSTFVELFGAVRNCISEYSLRNDSPAECPLEYIEGYKTKDLFESLNSMDSVKNFMSYLKTEDEKNYSLYCGIIQASFEGTSQSDIAESFSVNVRKIKYLTAKLYGYAKTFFQCGGETSIHTVNYVKLSNKTGSVILKKEGHVYKDSLTGQVVNISDSSRYHSTEKKGVRIYQVNYRIG